MGIQSLLRGVSTDNEKGESVGSRRNLFKILGLGAAGAVGVSLLEASPAGATTLSTLDVTGVAKFARSGVVPVPTGTFPDGFANLTVKVPGGLTAASHVLVQLEIPKVNLSNTNTWPNMYASVAAVTLNTSDGEFTVWFDGDSFKSGVKLAWFVFG